MDGWSVGGASGFRRFRAIYFPLSATTMAAVSLTCAPVAVAVISRRVALLPLRYVCVKQYSKSHQIPKRPLAAFLQFVTDNAAEINKNNPGMRVAERAKIASRMWHDLEPEVRDNLKLKAQEQIQAYHQKYKAYLDGLTEEEKAETIQQKLTTKKLRKMRKGKKELLKFGKPKLPPNSFLLFVRSSQPERGDVSLQQFIKSLADYWKQMPPKEKATYEEDAKLEQEKYYKDMAEWEDKMQKIGREDLIRKKTLRKSLKVIVSKAAKLSSDTGQQISSKKKTLTRKAAKQKRTVSQIIQTEE